VERDDPEKTPKIRYLSRREMLGLMGSTAAALTLGPCLPLIRVRSMPVPLLPPSMVSSQASRSNSVRQNKEQREILREVTINP